MIIIDKEKCIGCGLCVSDCVSHAVALCDGKAEIVRDCIKCGHCIAICPNAAVSTDELDMGEVFEISDCTRLSPEELMLAIKTRRSVRKFKKIPVESEKIDKIIEAGRFTATAENRMDVHYAVLQGNSVPEYEEEVLKKYRSAAKLAKATEKFIRLKTSILSADMSEGFLFYHAPAVIMVISKTDWDANLAAQNMELMAEALGLGVTYIGLYSVVANFMPRLRKKLGIGRREKLVQTLAVGYPDVKYRRTVPRRKADVKYL